MSKIKEMPEGERPRERLLKHGAQSLSEAQLLAIILRTGCGSKSALSLAMEIISRFGSLVSVCNASIKELKSITGLGDAKIAQLKAAFEIGKRLMSEAAEYESVFTTSSSVFNYMAPKVKGLLQEKFFCLILDVKNRLIKEHEVTSGTLNESLIHPREAFKEAIREAGASVIFAHNHPSGDPEPSEKDILATERLKNTGEIVGIKVLDHVILGDNRFISLKERGYL